MYSGEYDACDVTLSAYPHRVSLKNMPDHGGNRTYDLWNTSPMLCQLSYASAFFKEFSLGGGGGQNMKKRQNEKYEPSSFGSGSLAPRENFEI